MRIACWITGYKHTFRSWNTYCFPTASTVHSNAPQCYVKRTLPVLQPRRSVFTARCSHRKVITVSLGNSVIIVTTVWNVSNLPITGCAAQPQMGEADVKMDLRRFLYITDSLISIVDALLQQRAEMHHYAVCVTYEAGNACLVSELSTNCHHKIFCANSPLRVAIKHFKWLNTAVANPLWAQISSGRSALSSLLNVRPSFTLVQSSRQSTHVATVCTGE
jgi:hypothetical protein